jgi:hypothetical protein
MKRFGLVAILSMFILGGCATWDTAKKNFQGLVCPECKPVVIKETVPAPPVPSVEPTPALELPKATPKVLKKKKALPKLETTPVSKEKVLDKTETK